MDPLKHILHGPLAHQKEKARQSYRGFPAIIPGMSPDVEHACLAEIRSMAQYLSPWKRMPNGMSAGEFAFLYVHHFKQKRNASLAATAVK